MSIEFGTLPEESKGLAFMHTSICHREVALRSALQTPPRPVRPKRSLTDLIRRTRSSFFPSHSQAPSQGQGQGQGQGRDQGPPIPQRSASEPTLNLPPARVQDHIIINSGTADEDEDPGEMEFLTNTKGRCGQTHMYCSCRSILVTPGIVRLSAHPVQAHPVQLEQPTPVPAPRMMRDKRITYSRSFEVLNRPPVRPVLSTPSIPGVPSSPSTPIAPSTPSTPTPSTPIRYTLYRRPATPRRCPPQAQPRLELGWSDAPPPLPPVFQGQLQPVPPPQSPAQPQPPSQAQPQPQSPSPSEWSLPSPVKPLRILKRVIPLGTDFLVKVDWEEAFERVFGSG